MNHPGDKVLNGILRPISALYAVSEAKAEQIIKSFLKPRKVDEKAPKTALMGVFVGMKWLVQRHRAALVYTESDEKAADMINDGLVAAFTEGLNDAAYAMARMGHETWPITEAIVLKLVSEKVITLNQRKLKKRKVTTYNEQRVQGAIHSAIFRGIEQDDLPYEAAHSVANTRKNETLAAARAVVYGASDSGAYYAGLEAEKMGIEVEKTWLSIMDMNVRPSHKHLHGVTIPLHEVFHGFHGTLRYPHDPSAPPQETYHCRCRMVVHKAGQSPGHYSDKLLPTQTSAYRSWRDAQILKAGGELELEKLHRCMMRR